jgi:hypothetical protein
MPSSAIVFGKLKRIILIGKIKKLLWLESHTLRAKMEARLALLEQLLSD